MFASEKCSWEAERLLEGLSYLQQQTARLPAAADEQLGLSHASGPKTATPGASWIPEAVSRVYAASR